MSVYEVLQVSPDATEEEIHAKYKELARLYHPDKNNGDDTKMVELNEAYHAIDTPEKRTGNCHLRLSGLSANPVFRHATL